MLAESFEYGDLVAVLKLGTAQTILPGFQGKFAPLDLRETEPGKKLRHVSERKNGLEIVLASLMLQGFYQHPARAALLTFRSDGERTHFGDSRRIEMERAAAGQHDPE